MNLPAHIVCGACLAQGLVLAGARRPAGGGRAVALAAGAFALGVASHFLLDLLPHYAWVIYLDWFGPRPYDWLIRSAFFSLLVAGPAVWFAGRAWPYAILGMLGGIYPDLEKAAYFVWHLPERYLLFDWHGAYLSNRTGGLSPPVLIGLEFALMAAGLLLMARMRKSGRRPD